MTVLRVAPLKHVLCFSREIGIHLLICPILFFSLLWSNCSFKKFSRLEGINIYFKELCCGRQSCINAASLSSITQKSSDLVSSEAEHLLFEQQMHTKILVCMWYRLVLLGWNLLKYWLGLAVQRTDCSIYLILQPLEHNHPTCQHRWMSKHNGIMTSTVPPGFLSGLAITVYFAVRIWSSVICPDCSLIQ